VSRLTVVVTSPRLPPGLLSWSAWSVLRTCRVFASADAPDLASITDGEVSAESLDGPPAVIAATLTESARSTDTAWLAGPAGDETLLRAIGERLTVAADLAEAITLEVLPGSWDPPGARLLDVVTVMDRLRSPGGCPWDAQQTHASLAPYLIEEAYEALDSIESGDSDALRAELGDVLLQVAFHARLAQEQPGGWSIDDVAGGLVDKLIRRHPHVFADGDAGTADEVNANWETIKSAERGDRHAVADVPMGQPALQLAAALQRKATRAGVATELAGAPAQAAPAGAVDAVAQIGDDRAAAALLWLVVGRCRELGLDAESALRAVAREFRHAVAQTSASRTAGQEMRE
jgi:XTP/dITP diphosphohydrolase